MAYGIETDNNSSGINRCQICPWEADEAEGRISKKQPHLALHLHRENDSRVGLYTLALCREHFLELARVATSAAQQLEVEAEIWAIGGATAVDVYRSL